MKKLLIAASSVAVMSLFGAASASAGDFLTAPGKYNAVGDLVLYQTIAGVSCRVTSVIEVNSSGDANFTNVAFAPGTTALCGSLINPITTTWRIHKISKGVDEGEIRLDVQVQAGSGTCIGSLSPLTLYWGSKGPNRIESTTGSVPGLAGGAPTPCYVGGTLSITPVAPTVGEFRMN
ncbi:hypothetical protein GCM10009093_12100 [Brevundimonas terrae]|uniref:Protein activator of alkane oxidation PraB n=1 Tax=Brevundimonas terrae TaxID=363631 RepID=A0ABN0Y934_9CAUL|nr:hypothetical protein [Brevundimonas terrae]NIJ28008.1 hypothetical protein [Brevundimonas terrae]